MDLLERLVTIFGENGYAAVFLALMLCGAGAPLPEDITLVAGGIITGLGYGSVHIMVGVAMVGVLLGDSTMFLLGRHYGARILRWRFVARLLTPARYARVQEKFERYGNRLMFFARFLPGMRTAVYITAGATHRVTFLRFFILDGFAALISVPIWVYLGYFGANNHEWLVTWIKRGQTSLWIALAVIVVVIGVIWWRKKRKSCC
ncbi:membrane protein DedA with SNARE-associated domain [Luteibacter rhizovicinus]|uniref:Membrane protein DedA with SNARE-associated domain n=1 Tax=Luteibacter rhizovicinus TaxID=242606 RepID=A0A4R3YT94_9GAMM|nr:DedA family protein [Luteibacter rhizovicinus]TCV96147.1 membrane protein DedA with SNARE-associated domain [Luteibacter rhizovicinus]